MPGYPPQYLRFCALFNGLQFWAAHEALEELWRVDRDPFKQGLILLAAAFVHVQKNNPAGCRKCLLQAVARLAPHAPRHGGLDVQGILDYTRFMLDQVAGPAPGPPLWELIPFIELHLEDAGGPGREAPAHAG